MGRFDSEKGLCHLVFANEDNYYLQSLIRLNLRQYLYFHLKHAGYETVCFVSGDAGVYELTAADAESANTYDRYEKLNFFGRLKGMGQENNRCGKKIRLFDIHSFMERMLQMMKKEKNKAFIFPIDVFCQISGDSELIRLLCQAADKNYNRGNLLVIVSPVIAEASRPYFADPNGIFRSDLFPEIQQIFRANKKVHIYERLVDELGERVVFLNTLERNDIYFMILHKIIRETPVLNAYFHIASDFADFIWAWYHSAEFRKAFGALLPVNEKRQLCVIEKALDNKVLLDKMDDLVNQIRKKAVPTETLIQWICKSYELDDDLRLIYEDHALLRKLAQLPLETVLNEEMDFSSETIRKTVNRIRKELQKPSIIPDKETDYSYIVQCMDYMQQACSQGDLGTIEKAAKALEYGICENYSGSLPEIGTEPERDAGSTRWELHLRIIQVSLQLSEITRLYIQEEDRLKDYRVNFSDCIRELKEYQRMNSQIVVEEQKLGSWDGRKPVSPQLQHFLAQKSKAVGLGNDIRGLEHLQTTKLSLINSCKDNIQKLELAISSIAVGNIVNLRENLDFASDLIKHVAVDNHLLQKEISDASMNVRYSLDEMAMMDGDYLMMFERDIDKEFDALMKDQLLNDIV